MSNVTLPVAIHVLLLKDNKILLMRRENTGFNDGKWSIPAGRLESGETMSQGAAREAKEEVGVEIDPKKFKATHVMHHCDDRGERLYIFFLYKEWGGDPINCEPDKCSEISWFDISKLPANIIDHIKSAIGFTLNGVAFSEFGF